MTGLTADDSPIPEIDTSRPHPARMYDYYIGGKNHFAADRELADAALTHWPSGRIGLRENRRFLGRAVRYLAGEAGIRQFLYIGSGLPTTANVHEIAQGVDPYLLEEAAERANLVSRADSWWGRSQRRRWMRLPAAPGLEESGHGPAGGS